MKTSLNFRQVLTGALAIAALGVSVAAQAVTVTYRVDTTAGLVNQSSSCAANSWYNGCSSLPPGIRWTDTIPSGSTITSVSITFNDGVDCHSTGTVLTTTFNGTASPTYTATADCFCAPGVKLKTLALPVAAYVRGGVNTLSTTNPTTCLGNALTTIAGAPAYAVITVDYTAGGGGGGTGDCAPLEAKLDDGSRFTSDSERNNLLNGIVSEVNQNEVKIDAVRNAVAALETKADAAVDRSVTQERVEMEHALGEDTNVNKPMAVYMLPAANNGKLEAIRALVASTIANATAAGCSIGSAAADLAAGDAAYAASKWDVAYANYAQSYKSASAGPCN